MMHKTVFVKTDPSCILVERMMKEMWNDDAYKIVGSKEVTSNGFVHQYQRWYDFSRTAGAVMRLYMLMATDMRMFHDPYFSSRENLVQQAIVTSDPNPLSNIGSDINMAANEYQANRISADFDRLYPHYVLENKFRGMKMGQTRTHSGLMYVVDFPNGYIYHVVANLQVTRRRAGMFDPISIEAIPFVNAYRLKLISSKYLEDIGPNTRLIKELMDEYSEYNADDLDDNGIISGLGALSI